VRGDAAARRQGSEERESERRQEDHRIGSVVPVRVRSARMAKVIPKSDLDEELAS
jgi:hypothetical protein